MRKKPRFTHVRGYFRGDVRGKRFSAHEKTTERGNVAKKCLRFHAPVKMVFDYQSVTKYTVAASRQLAPEVIMVMFVSTLDTPRRG